MLHFVMQTHFEDKQTNQSKILESIGIL